MINPSEVNFVVCYDDAENLIIKKVSEVLYSGDVFTNCTFRGTYHVDIVKDEEGKTYSNAYTPGIYIDDVYYPDLQMSEMDYLNARVVSERELDHFLEKELDVAESKKRILEKQEEVILEARRGLIK